MKSLVPKFIENIKKGNIENAGKILKKNWDYKKKLNKFILNKEILSWSWWWWIFLHYIQSIFKKKIEKKI